MDYILASASPRRVKILADAGYTFAVVPSETDEEVTAFADAAEYARTLAERKAQTVAVRYPTDTVIGADTTVWIDGLPLGKPATRADAVEMLTRLNNKTHSVVTGVAVCRGEVIRSASAESAVKLTFREDEIERYIDTYRPYDKAGAYGLQELNAANYELIGEADNVVGLPIELTKRLIQSVEEL